VAAGEGREGRIEALRMGADVDLADIRCAQWMVLRFFAGQRQARYGRQIR
jgi:hypothetical protein